MTPDQATRQKLVDLIQEAFSQKMTASKPVVLTPQPTDACSLAIMMLMDVRDDLESRGINLDERFYQAIDLLRQE